MSTLIVRVWPDSWGFESPPGEIFNLEKLPKQQREQAAEIFDKRYVGTLYRLLRVNFEKMMLLLTLLT
jgi:hypothetical protein